MKKSFVLGATVALLIVAFVGCTQPVAEDPESSSMAFLERFPDSETVQDLRSRAPRPAARGMDVVVPAPQVLPPAFSDIRTLGDVTVYYAVTEGQMWLVAFETETLRPLYQVKVDPLLRIRGVGQRVLVDEPTGLVFVTSLAAEPSGSVHLSALDSSTGAEVWRNHTLLHGVQPALCGRNVCVRNEQVQVNFDLETGDHVDIFEVSGRRVLSSAGVVVTDVNGNFGFDGVEGDRAFVESPGWAVSKAELQEASGEVVQPGFGWGSFYDAATDVVVVYLFSAGITNGRSRGWVAHGLAAEDGEVLWADVGLGPCLEGFTEPTELFVCDSDGRLLRLDPLTGESLWSQDVGEEPELISHGSSLSIWTTKDGESTYSLTMLNMDSALGRSAPSASVCVNWWPQETVMQQGLAAQDFAGSTQFGLCHKDGYRLDDSALVAGAEVIELAEGSHARWLVDSTGAPAVLVD